MELCGTAMDTTILRIVEDDLHLYSRVVLSLSKVSYLSTPPLNFDNYTLYTMIKHLVDHRNHIYNSLYLKPYNEVKELCNFYVDELNYLNSELTKDIDKILLMNYYHLHNNIYIRIHTGYVYPEVSPTPENYKECLKGYFTIKVIADYKSSASTILKISV